MGFNVFGSQNLNFLKQKWVWVLPLRLHRMDAGWRTFLPWQPLTQYRCCIVQGLNLGCHCNNRGFKEGRWNVIQAVVLNEQGVLLMCSVVNSRWHLTLLWKWASCICSAPRHPFYAFPFQQFVDDRRLSSEHGYLCCIIAPLGQYCQVSPSHCFLYRLILPNPHNPTVAWVKYQVPAVSSHLLLGCDFCILLFTHRITTLKSDI